jgi:hypothetical protein
MNQSVAVIVLCGLERDSWINPFLMQRVIESLQDGMQARRQVAVGAKCGVRPVERARNELVKEFLASSCSWLVQIDNDVCPPPHFIKLIEEAEKEGKLIFSLPTPINGQAGLSWGVAMKEGKELPRFL